MGRFVIYWVEILELVSGSSAINVSPKSGTRFDRILFSVDMCKIRRRLFILSILGGSLLKAFVNQVLSDPVTLIYSCC